MSKNVGGAAGSRFGEGFVYIMRDGNQVKIGCSGDPKERLKEIKRDRPNTILEATVEATEMNGAETAAQDALKQEFQMRKIAANATDWFCIAEGISMDDIEETVRKAVKAHNRSQK